MTEAWVSTMVFVAAMVFAFVMLLALTMMFAMMDAIFFNGFCYKWVMNKLEGDDDE
jgi:hypothetical protein